MSEPTPPTPTDLTGLRIHRDSENAAPHSHKLLWSFFILLFLGAAGTLVWKLGASSTPLVRTGLALRVQPGQSRAVLTASAYLVSRNRATIGTKVPGRLDKIFVEEGSRVKAGDLLAELDSKDYQAHRNEAKANLADAVRELERQKNLLASGAGTQQKVDEQLTRLEVFKAQLDLAEVNLENTKITAPFEGVILQKLAEVGEMVSPGVVSGAVSSGAIVLLGSTEVEVEADVNESNLTKIALGQDAEIALDAFPERRFHGRVRLIEPKADRQKAVVQARITLLDPDETLRPEMGAKATFLAAGAGSGGAKETPFVTVPAEALLEMGSGKVVFVIEGDLARLRPVEVLRLEGGQAALKQGLSGGEIVILSPSSEIRDGVRVRVQP